VLIYASQRRRGARSTSGSRARWPTGSRTFFSSSHGLPPLWDAGGARQRTLLQARVGAQVRRLPDAGRSLFPTQRLRRPRAVHVEHPQAVHRLPARLHGCEASLRATRPRRAPGVLDVHLPSGRARRPADAAAQAKRCSRAPEL